MSDWIIENVLKTTNVLETWKPILPDHRKKENYFKGRVNEKDIIRIITRNHPLLEDNTNKKFPAEEERPDIVVAHSILKRPVKIEIKALKGMSGPIQGGGGRKILKNGTVRPSTSYAYRYESFDFMCITFDRESDNPKIVVCPWPLIRHYGGKTAAYKDLKNWENNFGLEGIIK
tara:strand:- start:2154 stop:2675 length:522 start_codon:yes stop_codon:yes gene_type:complete